MLDEFRGRAQPMMFKQQSCPYSSGRFVLNVRMYELMRAGYNIQTWVTDVLTERTSVS
jgi:hypothetical protein